MADQRPQSILVYFAHPVGAPDAAGVEANMQRARMWFRWLLDLPNPAVGRISWSAPWWAYVDTLGDGASHYRERGMRDTIAALERCDAIVAVGRLTSGVSTELGVATLVGLPSVNLVREGALPPTTTRDRWWEAQPTAGIIAELVDLVAKVERKRELRAAAPTISELTARLAEARRLGLDAAQHAAEMADAAGRDTSYARGIAVDLEGL